MKAPLHPSSPVQWVEVLGPGKKHRVIGMNHHPVLHRAQNHAISRPQDKPEIASTRSGQVTTNS